MLNTGQAVVFILGEDTRHHGRPIRRSCILVGLSTYGHARKTTRDQWNPYKTVPEELADRAPASE